MSEGKQKKRTWLWDILVIIGGLLGCCGMMLVLKKIGTVVAGVLFAMLLAFEVSYDLLLTSTSPSGEYVLEALRENTPAIEPYYVEVNLLEGDEKRTVYYVRGQDEAEIIWLSDTVAQINGVPVDVTSGDCFKANARGYLDVIVLVEALDVKRVHLTVSMGGEERLSRVGKIVYEDADHSGQRVRMRLNVLQELHWDDDLSAKKAGLTCVVESSDGDVFILPYRWEWTATEYGKYEFSLTGNAEAGYVLTPGEFACTAVDWSGEGAAAIVNSIEPD